MNGPLMLDLETTELCQDEIELLKDDRVGGVILFAKNFSNATQIAQLCESINEVREELIIAVDQEGGRVQRFDNGFTKLPAVAEIPSIAKKLNMEVKQVCIDLGWLMATEVRSVNVDISFAPVLDIDHGNSEIIGNRAFASSSTGVIDLAGSYIEGMQQAGMASCGKHFPGHGCVAADSHLELPVDRRSRVEVLAEMEPFKALVTKIQGVMPAHVLYPEIDHENTAGFSTIWVQQILRQQLGFNGVVFSDDLTMKGAAEFGSYPERARKALNAGCDMVLVCNDRAAVIEVLNSDVVLPNPDSSARIASLKSKKSAIKYADLQQNHRWQKLVSIINRYTQ